MNKVNQFLRIIDLQTVIVTALAILSTFLCHTFNLSADMPTGLIGVAIVFPIVFTINAAYRRREEALKYYASLKAHAIALYYAHRDWIGSDEDRGLSAKRARIMIEDLMTSMMGYFLTKDEIEDQELDDVYNIFSEFSESHEIMRQQNVPANEISRANQYLRAMIIEFERMKNILYYRTPIALRAYSFVFLSAFPILYGPYFAHLSTEHYPAVGYLVAIIYSLVLVSLDNIQENLENPFDGVGDDDMKLDVIKDYVKVMT